MDPPQQEVEAEEVHLLNTTHNPLASISIFITAHLILIKTCNTEKTQQGDQKVTKRDIKKDENSPPLPVAALLPLLLLLLLRLLRLLVPLTLFAHTLLPPPSRLNCRIRKR